MTFDALLYDLLNCVAFARCTCILFLKSMNMFVLIGQDLVLPSTVILSGLPGWHFNAHLQTPDLI